MERESFAFDTFINKTTIAAERLFPVSVAEASIKQGGPVLEELL
jgi:hypothetical protein